MSQDSGKIITALGPVAPETIACASMHEHLHCDMFDSASGHLIMEERRDPARLRHLEEVFGACLNTCYSEADAIERCVREADLVARTKAAIRANSAAPAPGKRPMVLGAMARAARPAEAGARA